MKPEISPWLVALTIFSTAVFTDEKSAAQPMPPDRYVEGPPGPPPARTPLNDEGIGRVFEENFGREPTRGERQRYLDRAQRDQWCEEDLRAELRNTREFHELTPEALIRRAFRDLLEREPDPQSLRTYRRYVIEQGWTAGQVRQAIRESDEFQMHRIDRVIDRAYNELLERAPDKDGRERYRKLLKEGLTDDALRDRLKQSVEYRVTLPDAKTTKAYRAVLGHDPDAHGIENYRKKIVDHGWTQKDVEAELRRSSEYLERAKKKP